MHLRSFKLEKDQTLVLVSDGVIEAMDPANEPLGFERLFSIGIREGADMEGQHRAMFRLIESHAAGAPQHDDATVVVLNRTTET